MAKQSETIVLPDQDPMLSAVGKGIQIFSTLEGVLGILFATLMEPADRTASVIAFDAIRNVETKLQVTQAVIDYRLKDEQLKRGRKIINLIRKRTDMRNKLAHWTASHWPRARTSAEIKKMKVVLVPSSFSKLGAAVMWAPKETSVKPITLKELWAFQHLCSQLISDIVSFSNEIRPVKDGAKRGQ